MLRKLAWCLSLLGIGMGLLSAGLIRWLGWGLIVLGGGYGLIMLRVLGEGGRAAVGNGRGPRGQYARLRGGHSLVGGRSRPHQCAAAFTVVAALVGRQRRMLVRHHGWSHLRGRDTVAYVLAAPVLRLSVPRRDITRVGVDAGEGGGVRPGPEPAARTRNYLSVLAASRLTHRTTLCVTRPTMAAKRRKATARNQAPG